MAKRLLVEDLSLHCRPVASIGIIGPNGAGKTTLFRMITGQEEPTAGSIRIGETVRLAYVDQSRDVLTRKTIWEMISDGGEDSLGSREMNSRAYVARFNFSGSDPEKSRFISGGERNRVHLARMLKQGPMCCCWMNRPTIWMSTPCAHWKKP